MEAKGIAVVEQPEALAVEEHGSRPWPLVAIAAAITLVMLSIVAIEQIRAGDDDPPTVAGASTQQVDGGDVVVAVAWGGREAGAVFDVALDSHSVELDGIDLLDTAILRIDGKEYRATAWEAPKGGHHRAGALTFPATDSAGQPLLGPEISAVELIIRDVAGVPERVFRWNP